MDLIAIGITAFLASLLTFFSGFGLSTILTPVFIVFFPVELAIAMTAVVHFLNNLFKAGLTSKYINWPVTLKFGIPAILTAYIGARVLGMIDVQKVLYAYEIFGISARIELIKVIISILMIAFALLEIVPGLKRIQFSADKIYLGGALSGFFGGLSGHQGALRSLFLLKCGLQKEAFIASGIMIALFIDISRISVYLSDMELKSLTDGYEVLLIAIASAFAGAFIGKKALKKVTLNFVQNMVSTLIILMAVLLGVGIL